MKEEILPQRLREEVTVRKFGGTVPSACREEDLEEEVTVVLEHGQVQSVTVKRPNNSQAGLPQSDA